HLLAAHAVGDDVAVGAREVGEEGERIASRQVDERAEERLLGTGSDGGHGDSVPARVRFEVRGSGFACGSGFGVRGFAVRDPRTKNPEPGTRNEEPQANLEPRTPNRRTAAKVLLARPVLSFRVPLKLFAVEVNVSQVALAVALGLIV